MNPSDQMNRYYYKNQMELERQIESLFNPESTVTDVILRLRGISRVSLGEGNEYLSLLDPITELKDGIVFSQTERYKNRNLGYPWLEDSHNAMNANRQYFIHRNGEGMIYRVSKKVEWVESEENPDVVLGKSDDLVLGK